MLKYTVYVDFIEIELNGKRFLIEERDGALFIWSDRKVEVIEKSDGDYWIKIK